MEKAAISVAGIQSESMKMQIYLKTAELFQKNQRDQFALGYYAMVLEREPRHPKALMESAQILFDAKNYQKAKASLETLLSSRTDHLRARFLAGKACFELHQYADAVLYLNKILDDQKIENDPVTKNQVSLLLADSYLAMKNFSGAIRVLTPLLSERHQFEPVLVKLVDVMVQGNELDQAIDLVSKNINQVNDACKCELYYSIGNAYFKKSLFIQALKAWQSAYEINPDYQDLSRLMNEYELILKNPKTEAIFITDEGKTEILLEKLSRPHPVTSLQKKKRFWIYKAGDFCTVLYRAPSPVSGKELQEIDDLVTHEYHSGIAYNLISLYGYTQGDVDNLDYKKITLLSGMELVNKINSLQSVVSNGK